MLEYDPVTSLRHYPVPMARFGQNPHGENLYRIVLASSRRHLVGGAWHKTCPDCEGSGGIGEARGRCKRCDGIGRLQNEQAYHWVPKYRSLKNAWILEKWRSAFEVHRMTKEQWDLTMVDPVSGWLLLGPYPSRGEYELAWVFDKGVDADNIDQVIGALNKGRDRTFGQVREAHAKEYAAEEKEIDDGLYGAHREAYSAYGSRPFSSSRVHGGTKTAPPMRTAQELGLPIPKFKGGKKKISQRRSQNVRDVEVTTSFSNGFASNRSVK